MKLLKIIEVEEPSGRDLVNWSQFWDCIEQTEDSVTFRFCPRPSHGGERLKGFEMILSVDNWNWLEFYKNILSDKEFIEMYFDKYLYGYSYEKFWHKMVSLCQNEFEECPHKTHSSDFGKMLLPKDYQKVLKEKGFENPEYKNDKKI
tara:strand:+ start:118 stop:558 length:441 start_codon:yes stop_codon:yes gene_type:complete